jgi:regulator of protease activity HflC (stomatin/prohibitin superfamily)
VGPNERVVLTTFGRAQRLGELSTLADPLAVHLGADERQRYDYPQVRVIGPGFYWTLPWQSVHRASIATSTVSLAYDPEGPQANAGGQVLDAVTKDQLNTGLSGQLRSTVIERNLYAYLFGVRNPVAHVMGYFVSSLRNRIANFEAPRDAQEPFMGIGVWCEMMVTDPVAYLYRNNDPVGSLRANVSNATVRCLSNMKLADMLEDRHATSRAVRSEVSDKSQEWGCKVGSIYVRKVHFRDPGMTLQIESNRRSSTACARSPAPFSRTGPTG